ncbi:MAG: hypothetical protein R3195_05195 [Gemmatimonadota bacterium]|nr:hypothetical protein [Gemmatimonadota bacterium]
MRMRPGSWVAGAVLLASTACASSGGGGAATTIDNAYGAMSSESAVGQFLDAAKRSDYQLMARLFGTRAGPAERTHGRVETEQRMYILASLLQHQSYSLRRMPVAEEEGQQRVAADMVGTRNGDVSVPFVVSNNNGRWFVEQIRTESLTGS